MYVLDGAGRHSGWQYIWTCCCTCRSTRSPRPAAPEGSWHVQLSPAGVSFDTTQAFD